MFFSGSTHPFTHRSSRSRKREPPSDISATLLFIKTQGLFMSHFFGSWGEFTPSPMPCLPAVRPYYMRDYYLLAGKRWHRRGVKRPLDAVWNSDPAGSVLRYMPRYQQHPWHLEKSTIPRLGAMEVEILRKIPTKKKATGKRNQKIPQQVKDMMDFFGGHPCLQLKKNDFPRSSFQRFKSSCFTNGLSLCVADPTAPPSSRLVLGLGLKNGSFGVLNFGSSALLEFDFIEK